MTSVGTAIVGRRSNSGAIAPWPAWRRLAASPAGSLPRRISRTRAARSGSSAVAGEHGVALPLVDEALDAVGLDARGEGLVGGPAGGALGLGRQAGGRALEDEAIHGVRVGDREPQRDARPQRVADDVRRDGVARGEQRGQRVRGRLDGHRLGWRVGAAVTGEARDEDPVTPDEVVAVLVPGRARAGEPVEQQDRVPGALVADGPADRRRRGHRRSPVAPAGMASAPLDGGRGVAVELDVALAVGAQLEDPHARPPDRVAGSPPRGRHGSRTGARRPAR